MATWHPFVPLAAFALALPTFAQDATKAPALSPTAAKIVAASREDNQVMEHLDYLTNSIGGRVTGSQSLYLASEWAADTFRSFGCENVRLEEWGEIPVAFERGPWFGAMMWKDEKAEHRVLLEFNTPSWSAGTKGLRRGRVFMQPADEAAFKAIEADLAGGWIVRTQAPRNFRRGQQEQGDGARFDSMRACEAAGILGTITGSRDNYLRTGNARGVNWRQLDLDNLPKLSQIQLIRDQFEDLRELLDDGVPVEMEFNIQNRFRRGPVKLVNVVADIPGTEKPDEFVMVGAHIDSIDGATGAVDDGSGCATTMEAARLILAAGIKPKRTIRFALWNGEEQGLLGSRAYVQQHSDEMAKVSAYLNHDNGTNFVAGVSGTEAMKADFDKIFAGVGEVDEGMPFSISTRGIRGGGSDHTNFIRAGVPAWQWNLSGTHNYGHIWHTQHDLYDEVVAPYQKHSAMVIAIGAVGIANLDHLLSREGMSAGGGQRRAPRGIGAEFDGMTIKSIEKDSTFAKAGFKPKDEILMVGDQEVESMRDLIMAALRAEEGIDVTVLRDGKKVKLKMKMERRRRR